MAVPVADDEALEAHFLLERVGQQPLVAVMLDPLPARDARHHGQRAGVDRRGKTHGVLRDQLLLVDIAVARILALELHAIGKETLGGLVTVPRFNPLYPHALLLQPTDPTQRLYCDARRARR